MGDSSCFVFLAAAVLHSWYSTPRSKQVSSGVGVVIVPSASVVSSMHFRSVGDIDTYKTSDRLYKVSWSLPSPAKPANNEPCAQFRFSYARVLAIWPVLSGNLGIRRNI